MTRICLALWLLLLLVFPAVGLAAPPGPEIEGPVRFVTDLEAPHYAIGNTVAEARFDLKGLVGYYVRARGQWLEGPSIFMKPRFLVQDFDVLNKGETLKLWGVIGPDLTFQHYRLVADFDLKPYVGQPVSLLGRWDMELSTPAAKVLRVASVTPAERRAGPGAEGYYFGKLEQGKGGVFLDGRGVDSSRPLDDFLGRLVVARAGVRPDGLLQVSQIQRLDDDLAVAASGDPLYAVRPDIRVRMSGREARLAAPPLLFDGRVLVDAYDLGRLLQAHAKFDRQSQVALLEGTGQKGDKGIKYLWRSRTVSTRQGMGEIELLPVLYNGSLMIPIRHTCEYFGFKVDWDQAGMTVLVD